MSCNLFSEANQKRLLLFHNLPQKRITKIISTTITSFHCKVQQKSHQHRLTLQQNLILHPQGNEIQTTSMQLVELAKDKETIQKIFRMFLNVRYILQEH